MNVVRSLPFFAWGVGSMVHLRKLKRLIDSARAGGRWVEEQEYIRQAQNYWGPGALKALHGTLEAEHLNRIPEGPVLFVSNHQGNVDIAVFMAAVTMKQHGFVAKRELEDIPYFGKWVPRIRSLMIERDDPRSTLRAFREGEEWLKQGFSLVIFPEGTRSRSDEMHEFKKGSLRMATQTGLPIVPVSLSGSWRLFEEKGYPQPWTVRFYVHEPIATDGLPKAELAGLNDRVEAVIRAKVDEWNAQIPKI
ncbi:MAG: 1-acyl-sn-glycerol-3-phosphate acyltransferase [Clostridiales Family XIII bacterium]|jgi:1-acyl-sn-glycerol-3-phosphate acyltransferase|nr:1-acyl-sn-glycerol-3-phosphate acyltransferase [Clostridiales Family XIII bacterium]